MRRVLPVLALVVSAMSLEAQQDPRTLIVPEGQRPNPVLSPALVVDNIVYASGQLGMGPDTTIQGQTKRTLENIKRVFDAAGAKMEHTIKCTVFLVDVADFGPMNEVYRTFFGPVPPARSTVVVKELVVKGAKIEIECLGAKPRS
ncbi:MAG: RidA family protein [Gemmatimonadaceae bacterium]|nr:RidA family protein [Gemmatimonadaceae bacterium]